MKKVLIIAYYYPPLGGGGIQRTIKFIKYLPQFGYEPVVIAPDNGAWIAYDQEALAEVAHVKTYRLPVPGLEAIEGKPEGPWQRINRFRLKAQNIFRPDPRWRWSKVILPELERIISEENIEVIFTTSPPHSIHEVGAIYKQNGGLVPWVADFRDSFYADPNLGDDPKSKVKRPIYKKFQARYIQYADAVVCATGPIAAKMIDLHGFKEKFQVITNGFDTSEIPSLVDDNSRDQDEDKYVITYTGSFLGGRSPKVLIEACLELLQRHPEWESKLIWRFVGSFSERDKQIFAQLPECMVEVIEYVGHLEALKYQWNSSANCLIIGVPKEKGGDEIFTGKIFEYIFAEKPILALVPEGIAKELIEKYRLGYVADSRDSDAISTAVENMVTDFLSGKQLGSDFKAAQKMYDRKMLTCQLASLFDTLLIGNSKGFTNKS